MPSPTERPAAAEDRVTDGADVPFFDVDLATARRRRSLKWRRYDGDVIPMWVAEMDFPLAAVISQRLSDMVERSDFGYPPEPTASTTTDFCEAVAGWMSSRYAWEIEPGFVSVAPDTTSVLEMAVDRFSKPGDGIALADPSYPPFLEVIENAGRVPVWIPMELAGDRWRLDSERLERAVTASHVPLFFHCNPHNPTGSVFTVDESREIAEVAERTDLIVVADEVHAGLSYGAPHVPFATVTPTIAARTITASAASKNFNFAGLRCGFGIAGTAHLHATLEGLPVRQRKLASLPGYEATIAAYTGGAGWLDAACRHLKAMRDHAAARLRDIDAALVPAIPEGTYLMWTDWRHLDLDDPYRFVLDTAEVALSNGTSFGPTGRGFLRLNFATSLRILDEALDRIANGVAGR